MDLSKLDGALTNALGEVRNPQARELPIFIRTTEAPDEDMVMHLRTLGVASAAVGRKTLTATVSALALDRLSSLQWVDSLRLSSGVRFPR